MSKKYYDEDGNEVFVEEPRRRGGCLKWGLIIIGVLFIVGSCSALFVDDTADTTDGDEAITVEVSETEDTAADAEETETVEETTSGEESTEDTASTEAETEDNPEEAETEDTSEEAETEDTSEEAEESQEATEEVPREYQNALRSAQNYVDMMHFSEAGLYNQLTSEYGEQYPEDAAQYAIENVDVDYYEEALEAAESYQEIMPMSDEGLYDQLTSEHGEQFTPEQAQYAIDNLGE